MTFWLKAWPLAALLSAGQVVADEPLAKAERQVSGGDFSAALATLDGAPVTPASRLLKGIALAGSDRLDEAARVLQALIAEQPQMPEPYNDLAAVYARQGRLADAKSALERGLATDPRYASIYRNLGLIYVQMARDSYAKALRVDQNEQTPRLALLTVPAATPTTAVPMVVAAAPAAPLPPAVIRREPNPVATVPAAAPAPVEQPVPASKPAPKAVPIAEAKPVPVVASAPAAVPVQPTPVTAEPAAPHPAAAKPAAAADVPVAKATPAAGAANQRDAVVAAIQGWAKAWAGRDAAGYLGHYLADYAPDGMDHTAWAAERRSRVTAPAWIKVRLDKVVVNGIADGEATVTLEQHYAAPGYKDLTIKRFTLDLRDGRWLISREISVQVLH